MKNPLRFLPLLLLLAACHSNNITPEPGWKKYFDAQQTDGCFALLDNGQAHFTIYNVPRYRDSAFLPASTFKIFNSLAALGTGRIFSDTVVLPWDGKIRTLPNGDTMHSWNKAMNMREAFAVNNVPFYQQLARRIGRDTMQQWLDSIHYGNARIGNDIEQFWLDNSLKITPDEQLGFIKRLYFKQLPFQNREQEIVRSLMVRESTDKYILAYKTGWGQKENGNQLGWMVGWIEENKHPYFFALNLESPNPKIDMVNAREEILKGILTEAGFLKGKK